MVTTISIHLLFPDVQAWRGTSEQRPNKLNLTIYVLALREQPCPYTTYKCDYCVISGATDNCCAFSGIGLNTLKQMNLPGGTGANSTIYIRSIEFC